jgi:hypothetical protein
MKKIPTLFKKDPSNLGRVINEINPENEWVLNDEGFATRKWDGTACAVINGNLCRRYDVKKGKLVPEDAIPCQDPDSITGHWPHWVMCNREDPADKYHFEAFDKKNFREGTYELIGEKVNGNREQITGHVLVAHKHHLLTNLTDFSFEYLKKYLTEHDIEGIVFHHFQDSRMCKIRKSDFGLKRGELT